LYETKRGKKAWKKVAKLGFRFRMVFPFEKTFWMKVLILKDIMKGIAKFQGNFEETAYEESQKFWLLCGGENIFYGRNSNFSEPDQSVICY